MRRSNESGIAMVLALFMVLAMSVVGTSLMFVSQTETLSSQNYRNMSQARYAAESGVHRTANYLLNTYSAPGSMVNYVTTVSPVTYNGNPVVLSSEPSIPANYPVAATQTQFAAATTGTLDVNNGNVTYTAHAKLLSMRQIEDFQKPGTMRTLQTWEITGIGTIGGGHPAQVEVSAVIERQISPVFTYAAFATHPGCAALSFAGGATTDSYNSAAYNAALGGPPSAANGGLDASGGHVGTNGNLDEAGNTTTIHGSLSTPRSGVGSCTSNNITAQTIQGGATVDDGLVALSQSITYPTPDPPSPMPGTGTTNFGKNTGCPAAIAANCAPSTNGATITPDNPSTPVVMENVDVGSQAEIHLKPGVYIMNSFNMNANARIIVDDGGPVAIHLAGQGFDPGETVMTITGNGISNTTYSPNALQFIYGGEANVSIAGGAETAALFYMPNATGSFTGGSDIYGAVVLKQLTASGGASIHYDTNLQNSAFTAGNHMMSAFTWKSF